MKLSSRYVKVKPQNSLEFVEHRLAFDCNLGGSGFILFTDKNNIALPHGPRETFEKGAA